jgi:hypothetical protein
VASASRRRRVGGNLRFRRLLGRPVRTKHLSEARWRATHDIGNSAITDFNSAKNAIIAFIHIAYVLILVRRVTGL